MRSWPVLVALPIGAFLLGMTVTKAASLTPDVRCGTAKARATLEWQQCRLWSSNLAQLRNLPAEKIATLQQGCDDQHTEAFEKAERAAQKQDASACPGDDEVVRDRILGSGLVLLGGGASSDHVGVNIFGLSGFEDQQTMIGTLFQYGVRKFRVNNVGGWPDEVYEAIDAEAGKLSAAERDKVSVYVPSQYFAGQFDVQTTRDKFASWSNIPHWIVQLDACNPLNGQCANPTESGLSQTDMADYLAQIGSAIPAFEGQAYRVEFVIPYQDATASPDAKLAQVKAATVDAFPQIRFTLERTEYPFWDGSTNPNFPFDAAHDFDQLAKSKGFAGAYFAESGWPRSCDVQPATATLSNQCAYLQSLIQGTFPDPSFVTYWWLMGAEDVGDGCGPDSWGLFDANATLACPGSF